MKISLIIQNFWQKTYVNTTTTNDYPHYGISFNGKGAIRKDTFTRTKKALTAKEFRKLNRYMVDLYTAEPMLSQEQLDSMRDKKMFKGSIHNVVKKLKRYADKYLTGVEAEVFARIEEASKTTPNLTLPELFNSWYIKTRNEFRKTQRPSFDKIKRLSKKLPPEQQEKFNKLMKVTRDKLYDKPIVQDFSLKSFEYQVKKSLINKKDKYKKQISVLLLSLKDESLNEKNVFLSKNFIKQVLASTKLNITKEEYFKNKDLIRIQIIEKIKQVAEKNNDSNLVNLCEQNIKLLQHEPVNIPFSNKTFIYELNKILDEASDPKLKAKISSIWQNLPKSNNNAEALILKYRNSDENTIGYRLFSPSLVSIEHLMPASLGGPTTVKNCALAKMKYNNERSSEPLHLTFKRYDHKAQQLYTDKLIKLVNLGLLPKEDALGQIMTIEREGHIKLNYQSLL